MYLKNKVIGIVARAQLWSKKIVDFSMRLFDMALRRDNDFGGYINGADGTGAPDRTPRYGPSRLESLANILSFATRHMGKNTKAPLTFGASVSAARRLVPTKRPASVIPIPTAV